MAQTRAEWQTERDADNLRTGSWGFDPEMPWHIANWKERLGILFFYGFMWGVVFPGMLIGALMLLGMMVEGAGRYNAEHDLCLKHATNGYEIKQCH